MLIELILSPNLKSILNCSFTSFLVATEKKSYTKINNKKNYSKILNNVSSKHFVVYPLYIYNRTMRLFQHMNSRTTTLRRYPKQRGNLISTLRFDNIYLKGTKTLSMIKYITSRVIDSPKKRSRCSWNSVHVSPQVFAIGTKIASAVDSRVWFRAGGCEEGV